MAKRGYLFAAIHLYRSARQSVANQSAELVIHEAEVANKVESVAHDPASVASKVAESVPLEAESTTHGACRINSTICRVTTRDGDMSARYTGQLALRSMSWDEGLTEGKLNKR
ncbi:hypothetical protein Tco_1489942 [Tanacetum coccineum]